MTASENSIYKVLLYYKYVTIEHPKELMRAQRELCERLGLKGRILIAREGINGTLEGTEDAIEQYCMETKKHSGFEDIWFKKSDGIGDAFPKLVVKVRNEIVTGMLEKDIDPIRVTGKYLSAEELHTWFEEGKEFYIVDMRNDYEQRIGHFEGSLFSGMENFRDLAATAAKLANLKDKTILTVCTGGVRCEKASGFLVENDFKNVYQLHGGIVTYMEKYPNEHFKGKLYVFDKRICMGFNTDAPEHEIIGCCEKCNAVSENFVNCANNDCHKHFICCTECVAATGGQPYCREVCVQQLMVV
jgi:UPF0176 protein